MADGPHEALLLQIGTQRWAIGLEWQVADMPGGHFSARAAREIARKAERQYYATHVASGGAIMLGLAAEQPGIRPGLPALASAIVKLQHDDFIAAVRLPADGTVTVGEEPVSEKDPVYYIIASRDGAVRPETDQVVTGNSPAVRQLQTLKNKMKYSGTVFAPREMGFPGGAEEWRWQDIAEQLVGKDAARLQRASYERYLWAAARMAALIAVAAGVWTAWTWIRGTGDQEVVEQVRVPAAPWSNQERGVLAAELCLDAFAIAPVAGPGWDVQSMACTRGEAAVALKAKQPVSMGGTPYEWLEMALTSAGYPPAGLAWQGAKDPQSATYTLSVPVAKVWLEATKVRPIDKVIDEKRKLLNAAFADITLGSKAGEFFRSQPVTIKTAGDPRPLIALFDDVAGLTLQSVSYDRHAYTIVFAVHEVGREPDPAQAIYEPPPPVRKANDAFAPLFERIPRDQS